MRTTRSRLAAIPSMVGECLYDAVSDCQCIPPGGTGDLYLFSSPDRHCQVGMFVADGIALRYR